MNRMKLSDWLKMNGVKRYVFARRIGVQPSMVTAYCENGAWPKPSLLEAIVRETNGQVTPNDFLQNWPEGDAAAATAAGAAE